MCVFWFTISSCLVLTSVFGHPPISDEQKKIVDDCKRETDWSGELKGLSKDKNCFAACIMQKSGVLTEGGIDKSKMIEKAQLMFPSGISDNAKHALAECADLVEHRSDLCETAFLLVECKREQLAKLNIDPSVALGGLQLPTLH